MVVCGVFAWAGAALVEESYLFGEVMPTGFGLPLWIPHASVALGMALGLLSYAIVLARGQIAPASAD
jgi:TRAP-type C4-dicarboxylate transport system permease small subunit